MSKKKAKILFIEDDKFLRKVYREKFERSNFEFIEAITGNEGISKARAEKPDLILLDLMLPGKSGFEVLIELKSSLDTKDIPVVVLSNLGQESDKKRCFDLGAVHYIVKPEASLSQVVNEIKECLVKHKREK
jgi:DNA-binding response OmpR family regulator